MKMNLKLFKEICKFSQNELLEIMTRFLESRYDKVIATSDYIIAEGDLPVALLAHLDTVGVRPPSDIYYDPKAHVMWSPQLLGADDRAGVYAIIDIIQAGYRPSIILTTEEETGCLGALFLAEEHPECPIKNLKALIQLDRQGENDSVYYDCDNKRFKKFINSYGFNTAQGSFSDISVLGPAYQIAAVNLSVGYLNEHNPIETLNVKWLSKTIEKVKKIIVDIDSYPAFEYVRAKNSQDMYHWLAYAARSYSALPVEDPPIPAEDTCAFCQAPLGKDRVVCPDGFTICQKCFKEAY